MRQLALDVRLDTSPTLENFYLLPQSPPPSPNAVVLQHLRLWLGHGRAAHTRSSLPIYIWGNASSGKTHLLKAIAHGLGQRAQACGWMDSTQAEPQGFDAHWDAILLDDVHLYSAAQQHAAFNWFIHAQGQNAAIVSTADRPPAQLGLREDLRTRLGWGDVFGLETPGDSHSETILLQSAQARGLQLGRDVLSYLNSRFSRDLGSQLQWLDRLDQYALQTRRAITLPLLKEMMLHLPQDCARTA